MDFSEVPYQWAAAGYLEGLPVEVMNAVLGGTVVVGLVFVCLNIFSDLLYKFFDPRAK